MKRLIIYTLIGLFSLASFPSDSLANASVDGDRDKGKGKAKHESLAMKPKKLSKKTAKMRQQSAKERQKHMANIKRSNKHSNKK